MSKASENRKARRKRDKRFKLKMAHKHFDDKVYRARGVNPNYYIIIYSTVGTKVVKGKRYISILKSRVRVIPNAKYHNLMKELTEKFSGMKIPLKEIFPDGMPDSND